MRDGGGGCCDKHARYAAPDYAPDDKARGGVDGWPTEEQDCADEGPEQEGVDRFHARAEEVRDCAAEEGRRVRDGEQVEGGGRGLVQGGAREGHDVEERDVVCREEEEERQREEVEWEGAQRLEVEEGAWCGGGRRSVPEEDGEGEEGEREVDEGDGAHGPGEADGGLQLAEHDGEDYAAHGGAERRDADGDGAFGREVRGYDGQGGNVGHALAKASADALREEDGGVGGREGGGHHAEDGKKAACCDERAEVAPVEEGAYDYADGDDEEGLDAADPGYC